MKIEIKEMPRASEGDSIEIEGKVILAKKPNSNDFEGKVVWSQFIVLKDSTGEQGCWLKLDGEEDKVAKGSSIIIKGKVGKEYEDSKGKTQRSINNCEFEVMGKVQGPAQSSGSSAKRNGNDRDNYWAKKFEWDKKVHFSIVRECAVKAVTELAKIIPSKTFLIKVHTEKDYFEFADKIRDYICRTMTAKTIAKEEIEQEKQAIEASKEERLEEAREIVRETRFRPASTKQENIIFGYKDKEGYHKGIIDSRYIETHEIKEIGDPKKISVEKASEWIAFWWGDNTDETDIGARAKREMENPRDENGKLVNALVKGDKISVAKDILVDEIYALRRENRLNDDAKFKKEMGYNPKIEELTEEECLKLKDLLKRYVPF